MTRRRDLLRAAPLLGATALLPGCSPGADYAAAVAATWRHVDAPPAEPVALQRELVRYATLAANSHNTQPWRFELLPNAIVIRPDASRRTPVADPDNHHLWASLGCATENLVQAAAAFGRRAGVGLAGDRVVVTLEPMPAQRSALFEAIVERQCTRSDYDGSVVSPADLQLLDTAARGPGLRLVLITDRARIEQVAEHVVQAATAQMQDPRFVSELKQWIRFGEAEALATRDGLFAAASGNPALPRWLGSLLFGFLATPAAEAERYARQLRSSSGIAVFVSERSDAASFVEAGRAYQRFALQATALGLRNAFVNPPVEIAVLRSQFGTWLDLGGARPDFIVRFGRAPALPRSLRRPLEKVIG
jgi:nitroreductase